MNLIIVRNVLNPWLKSLSAGAVEYADFISAEGLDSHNECPRYDTKKFDGEAPECGIALHCHRSQVHSDQQW